MAGMLNIGLTGLNAAQLQLNTTSHNISNAGTVGYSRQTVSQTTNVPQFSGAGFFGQGTRIASVTREYSQFLENQVLSADNRRSEYAAYGAQIAQINNLLADPTVGLSPAVQEFFAGVQEVSANPASVPARQSLISAAQALASRFNVMDARLNEIRDGVEGEIEATVASINLYARELAEINQRIVVAQAAGAGLPANDLLDQRNVLLSELNKLVKTTAIEERDGQLNVFIGSGQPLVLGQTVSTLTTITSSTDPTRQAIAMQTPGGGVVTLPERLLTGGQLGGLLSFRRDSLDQAQNQLGLLALSLATEFNRVHELGVDLDNMLGGPFFRLPGVVTRPDQGLTVEISSISELTGADYEIRETGGGFELVNLASGRRENLAGTPPAIDLEGLSITLDDPLPAGLEFPILIQPTRFAARDIGVAINDPRKVAAGSPVTVNTPVTNTGTGEIGSILVNNVAGIASDPVLRLPDFANFAVEYDSGEINVPAGYQIERVRFDTSSGQWVTDTNYASGGTATEYSPASDSAGARFRLTGPGGYEFDFELSGSPKDEDVFRFGPSEAGIADNRNAARLGALQTDKTMFASSGGAPTATFQSVYSQLVSKVGNKTREVQAGEKAQETLLRQASDARDALSGVNLDEEAANLIRFQQAYQASARVMSIAQRLFDEVVSLGR